MDVYEKESKILYGTSGVYRVDDIGPVSHMKGSDPNRIYYKLVSIRNGAVSYIPVDGPLYTRPVLTKEEASSLLDEADQILPEIHRAKGPYELKLYYKEVFESHDCRRLIAMLKGINVKIRSGYYRSRKIGGAEFDYKKKAEWLLAEELSAALGIDLDEAHQQVKLATR